MMGLPVVGVIHCIVLASFYVGSLYVFKGALSSSRNDPAQVRRRTWAVVSVCVLSVVYTFIFDQYVCNQNMNNASSNQSQKASSCSIPNFFRRMGMHFNILKHILAVVVAVLLNSFLFMGPIVHLLMEENILTLRGPSGFSFRFDKIVRRVKALVNPTIQFFKAYPSFMLSGNTSLVSTEALLNFRGLVIGSVSEEIVFRSCMYSLSHYCGDLSPKWTIIVSSLVFGLAHCHHIVEHILHGEMSVVQAIINVTVQLTYTSLFAAYNGYIFIRTGSVWASIVMHSYCNYLGLPDFQGMLTHEHKFIFSGLLISGLFLFFYNISPMTTQLIFGSVYYK